MRPLTEAQLLRILPNARPVAGVFVPALNRAMSRFKIDSPVRRAAFLAQIGHESGHLRRLTENLNYSDPVRVAQIFRSGFDLDRDRVVDPEEIEFARGYVRNPQRLANRAYAGRNGNGVEDSGDGWKYRGRGLIQLTGRDNYRECGKGIGQPLEDYPDMLEIPEWAALSAAWFWARHELSELADAGRFEQITRRINGGTNGQAERLALWRTGQGVLA